MALRAPEVRQGEAQRKDVNNGVERSTSHIRGQRNQIHALHIKNHSPAAVAHIILPKRATHLLSRNVDTSIDFPKTSRI